MRPSIRRRSGLINRGPTLNFSRVRPPATVYLRAILSVVLRGVPLSPEAPVGVATSL